MTPEQQSQVEELKARFDAALPTPPAQNKYPTNMGAWATAGLLANVGQVVTDLVTLLGYVGPLGQPIDNGNARFLAFAGHYPITDAYTPGQPLPTREVIRGMLFNEPPASPPVPPVVVPPVVVPPPSQGAAEVTRAEFDWLHRLVTENHDARILALEAKATTPATGPGPGIG